MTLINFDPHRYVAQAELTIDGINDTEEFQLTDEVHLGSDFVQPSEIDSISNILLYPPLEQSVQ